MISRFDSKALPNFVPPSNHGFWLNGLNRKNETLGKGTACRKRSRKWQRDERREWVGTPLVGYTAGSAAWRWRSRGSNACHPCAANPWADLIIVSRRTSAAEFRPRHHLRRGPFRRTKCSHLEVG